MEYNAVNPSLEVRRNAVLPKYESTGMKITEVSLPKTKKILEPTIAVYAGSLDPFTVGHKSIVDQAKKFFDLVYVVIARNPSKSARRVEVDIMMPVIKELFKDDSNVIVTYLETYNEKGQLNLVADYCSTVNAKYYIRGLRDIVDYANEFSIMQVHKRANPNLRPMYLEADDGVVSSSMVWAFHQSGRNVNDLLGYDINKIL